MSNPTALDAASLFRVVGLIAVITGGGSGLGYMMAKALVSNGAERVYIVGRRLEKLEEATAFHDRITPLQADVTSKDDLAAIAAQVKREVGYVDLLVCNSGLTGPMVDGLPNSPSLSQFQEYCWKWTTEEFTAPYEVNTTAVFFTTVAFLGLLDAANKRNTGPSVGSQVIVMASIAAFNRCVKTGFAYVASKAGTIHLAKSMSSYFVPYGIRVNAFAPGLFITEMTEDEFVGHERLDSTGRILKLEPEHVPAGRSGSEEDMAGSILYLASRAGAYLNGCVIVMDGGRLSVIPSTY